MAANRLGVGPIEIRRGALFLVGIGAPLVYALLAGEPQQAVLGAVVGMLLAFADDDGPPSQRFRILILDALAVAAGGCAGYLLKDHTDLRWAIFIAIAFAVGLGARGGRLPLLTGRHGAMAFVVASAVPQFSPQQAWYLLGVLALTAAARVADHLSFGSLPRLQGAPMQVPSAAGGWLRFALAFAAAATAAMWLGGLFDPTHRYWIVITTLVVMQPDAALSYRRIAERVAGTVCGVIVAGVVTLAFHQTALICVAVLVVAPFIPHHLMARYWLHTGLIALMVLLVYDLSLLNADSMAHLLIERVLDIVVGCMLALVGTAMAFPHEAIKKVGEVFGGTP
jgi:hypothetical protein